jgi:hypothetical protein
MLDAVTDLSLILWNVMFYNESDSQIAHDAETLKVQVCTVFLVSCIHHESKGILKALRQNGENKLSFPYHAHPHHHPPHRRYTQP